MGKIILGPRWWIAFGLLVICGSALADAMPQTRGQLMQTTGAPDYLAAAANAWAGVIGGTGKTAIVAQRMTDAASSNINAFRDIVSVLAYNESPITIFETLQHLEDSFANIALPLDSRKTDCVWENGRCFIKKTGLIISARLFGGISDFTSEYNGDFSTKRSGINISASGYVAPNITLGVGYTRTTTDTDDKRIYTDATTNSVSAFAKYLSPGGIFINGGASIGQTNWTNDKFVSGIEDDSEYDSDFYAAEILIGKKISSGKIFATPYVGARWINVKSGMHTDDAVQTFNEWSYNALTGMANLRIGGDFIRGDFLFAPNVFIGGSYDAMRGGSNVISATLSNGAEYFIPVESPDPAALNAGLGLAMTGEIFVAGLEYRLDSRQNFMSHTVSANFRMKF
ncbi:MAG: autotransporter domain-containing protein [Rickettsiales bacterium]|jgi:hypothetical protein|nr:autotransporter domain-containing protein [Rickettsiales bacterium]